MASDPRDREGAFAAALAETLDYLGSPAALAAVAADAYWPKWNGPWWRMLLLHELGLADRIPRPLARALASALAERFVPFFPSSPAQVPAGMDPIRNVACHCQLGCMYQVLVACGVDLDSAVPWVRPWFVRYQLPDGGLNCDDGAYARPGGKSSVVSTLPPLEAILYSAPRPLSAPEVRFLDAGARYLIERRLFRSVSRAGAVMDEKFLRPCFPRFYDYDVLRGLTFLVRWVRELGRELPEGATKEAVELLERAGPAGELGPSRRACADAKTFVLEQGQWVKGRAAMTFALLDEVGEPGRVSPWLSKSWREARAGLAGC